MVLRRKSGTPLSRPLRIDPLEDRCLLSVQPFDLEPQHLKIAQGGPDPLISINDPADDGHSGFSEFQISNRWSSTATNGSGTAAGQRSRSFTASFCVTTTWSARRAACASQATSSSR